MGVSIEEILAICHHINAEATEAATVALNDPTPHTTTDKQK